MMIMMIIIICFCFVSSRPARLGKGRLVGFGRMESREEEEGEEEDDDMILGARERRKGDFPIS